MSLIWRWRFKRAKRRHGLVGQVEVLKRMASDRPSRILILDTVLYVVWLSSCVGAGWYSL